MGACSLGVGTSMRKQLHVLSTWDPLQSSRPVGTAERLGLASTLQRGLGTSGHSPKEATAPAHALESRQPFPREIH